MSDRVELIATLAARLLGRTYESVIPAQQGGIYIPEQRITTRIDSPAKAVEVAVKIIDLAGRA